jgi:mono/diheme cytochrome c family protein
MRFERNNRVEVNVSARVLILGTTENAMRVVRSLCVGGMMLLLMQVSPQLQQPPVQPASTPPANPTTPLPPGNLQHGRYIVENVAMCVECHSGRDGNGNIVESERFLGGPIPFAPPWSTWATRAPRNRGLPGYTDALALRLLTQGAIGRKGEQLKPPMPRFHMTVQDAADVIAYMRSLH